MTTQTMEALLKAGETDKARALADTALRKNPEDRTALFARDAAQLDKPQHMARLISWALADLMLAHPEVIVCGEDVGPKGGVYNCTARLHER